MPRVGNLGGRRSIMRGLNTKCRIVAGMIVPLLLLSAAVLAKPYAYVPPEATNDGWATAALTDERMDGELIRALFERIGSGDYKNITSVVVARGGKLVASPGRIFSEIGRGRSNASRRSSCTRRRRASRRSSSGWRSSST
jgi:hypothetical protein